ncbi:MAG: hypothetical protein HKN94_09245 [Acidimicrobiales bacterium]|nr:hypothetical protein [Acidimicrobiia bacterium]NNC80320.1 hypothetical protein [Acidimicrobiales bacterium]RZV48781.1 MAG: hypothetical protein EX269_00370 [Acidimicrobiales bacterium]
MADVLIRARPWTVVLALTLFAAGCGSDTPEGSFSAAVTVPATTTSTTAAPETTEATAAPTTTTSTTTTVAPPILDEFGWSLTAEAPWSKRAGLRVVELDGRILMMGGRTPNQSTIPGDSEIWADVWATDDLGASWIQVSAGGDHWSPRAYFQVAKKSGEVFVLGGQDYGLEPNPFCALLEQGLEPPPELGIDPDAPCPEFFPTSQFFNDVWKTSDGVTWEQMTEAAPWAGRAGLSAEVLGDYIYVLGGSQNDDSSIIGANGPQRIYYNDVWRSDDGASWQLMTESAPWEPRAGGVLVVKDDAMYLLGGEDGFTCSPLPDCEAPYFNDVWRSVDGASWDLVAPEAGWSPRPGHVCEVLYGEFVCFGGFGLIENPMDIWASADGATWRELADIPWGAEQPEQMRYDFDSLVTETPDGAVLLTFGGDRETFDFADPDNWTRVDNDVWAFASE